MWGNIPNWVLLIVQLILMAFMGGIWYFVKKEFKKTEMVERDLREFELHVAEEYVRKEDYNKDIGEVMKRLDNITDLLIRGGN